MENRNKLTLSNFMFFSVRKTKSKDTNTIHVSNSNSSEKNDDKYLFEEEKCSISAHNRTHRLFRSIKDKFKKSKFGICKVKQKVTACESKSNHTAFDGMEPSLESKEFSNPHSFSPPLVPPRQRSTSSKETDTGSTYLLSNCQLLSTVDDISLTTCTYGNYSSSNDIPPSLQSNSYSTSNSLSFVVQIPQGEFPCQRKEDVFNKNTYVDIIDFDSSSNNGSQEYLHNASFSKDFSNLMKCGYYWGPITRREAEEKLSNQPDGTFLIRDSASENHLFSLSFRSWGKTLHTRIEYSVGIYSICDQGGYPTIVELIDKTMQISKNTIYCYSRSRTPTDPAYPVRLTLPLSRFMRIRSLRHLCRFVIRQHINKNDIDKLKLPEAIKNYLEEGYF